MREEIRDISGLVDLKDNFVKGKPEIRVRVDKEKAALLGLDTFTIADTFKAAINGAKAGVYREGKDEYDIIARLANDIIKEIDVRLQQNMKWPRGYAYCFSGEQEEQAQAFLIKAFVAAIAIILLILLTQFNSFVTPFIIRSN